MIIIVKPEVKQEQVNDLIHWIESQNLRTHLSTGDYSTIIGVIGDTSKLDSDLIRGLDIVIVTTAKTDEEARELLTLMGAPFRR